MLRQWSIAVSTPARTWLGGPPLQIAYARPEQAPIKGKKRPQGGSSFHLRRRLSELLDAGHDPEEAARLAGCSKMTARRVRNQLARQVDEAEAA